MICPDTAFDPVARRARAAVDHVVAVTTAAGIRARPEIDRVGTVAAVAPTPAAACGSYGISPEQMDQMDARRAAHRYLGTMFFVHPEVLSTSRTMVSGDSAEVHIQFRWRLSEDHVDEDIQLIRFELERDDRGRWQVRHYDLSSPSVS